MATKYEQMLMFEEPLDIKVIRACREMRESYDKSRKSQFAKIGELKKKVTDLEERLAIIENGICRESTTSSCEILEISL